MRSGVRDCAVRFVYLCYHSCPRTEFLKAYSSESECEFGQEECDDSETLSSTERSESPVRDLNESAVRQVYLVTYSQADLKKFPTRRCFAEAVIRSFHGTNGTFCTGFAVERYIKTEGIIIIWPLNWTDVKGGFLQRSI